MGCPNELVDVEVDCGIAKVKVWINIKVPKIILVFIIFDGFFMTCTVQAHF